MIKVACQFKPSKGPNKDAICGKPCIRIEGKEARCALHKESYLMAKNEKKREKYEAGLYTTKNQRISDLERLQQETNEKCAKQDNQIGMLSEDLSIAKERIASIRKENNELRNELDAQKKNIAQIIEENRKIRVQLQKCIEKEFEQEKVLGEVRRQLADYKRLYDDGIQERNNMFAEVKRIQMDLDLVISNSRDKERRMFKAELEMLEKERKQREEEMRKDFDKKLSDITNKTGSTFKIVLEKLNAITIQCDDFFAKSRKKPTIVQITDQIKRNTSDIDKIKTFIGEQMKKNGENEDNTSKSLCMPQ